jgi:hypothetical protein
MIVINFQSWLDPFIIITALPAALTGMGWVGLEPTTNALKGRCSTIELPTRQETSSESIPKSLRCN